MRIALASGSPRRRELMSLAGFDFDIIIPDVDETVPDGYSPEEAVSHLSKLKAEAVFEQNTGYDVIVAADTVVAVDGVILGKPKGYDDAYKMLSMLSGRTHSVFTGVTVIKGKDINTFYCKSDVVFYDLSEDEINAYLATNEYCDKAGSYGIQGKGCVLVKEIHGDYFNIVGLPIAQTARIIRK